MEKGNALCLHSNTELKKKDKIGLNQYFYNL